ncbi:MAG TPA: hypothetical protein VGF36_16015, partial [Rhodopila sp.]
MLASIPPDRQARLDALADIETDLRAGRGSLELSCQRAALLDALGRTSDAWHLYEAALIKAPD